MSELKARGVDDVYIEYYNTGKHELAQVYLKSEADRVIAELEMKLAVAQQALRLNQPEALYSDLETMGRLHHEIDVVKKREQHQKYKRCLVMALLWLDRSENSTDLENELVSRRRYGMWLELAEKFKEAK